MEGQVTPGPVVTVAGIWIHVLGKYGETVRGSSRPCTEKQQRWTPGSGFLLLKMEIRQLPGLPPGFLEESCPIHRERGEVCHSKERPKRCTKPGWLQVLSPVESEDLPWDGGGESLEHSWGLPLGTVLSTLSPIVAEGSGTQDCPPSMLCTDTKCSMWGAPGDLHFCSGTGHFYHPPRAQFIPLTVTELGFGEKTW